MANEIKPITSTDILPTDAVVGNLMSDLRQIIDEARIHVASTANYELTMMYWHIGERINRDVLGNERAEYGKQIVATVSRQLQNIYGHKGFDVKSLYRHMQFATLFPDAQIVSTASRQLSWSHFVELLPLKDELQRDYYFTLASVNRWSVRQLRKEIDAMLYERTALASKPEEVVKQELVNVRDNKHVSPDVVFKSPYFLEFTGLNGMYSEKDLEDSLVAHLEQFILELGNGFCFAERQKRMIIDGRISILTCSSITENCIAL